MTPSLRPTFVAIALGACLLVGAAACGSGDGGSASAQGGATGTVHVEEATIDWPANPTNAAIRMVVRNDTATADTLLSVASPVARTSAVHRSQTDDQGRSVMLPEADLPIPARSSVTFAPGGLHVMLSGITEDLQVGDDVAFTLTFEHAGTVHATAKVVQPGTAGDDTEGTHDH